MNNETIWAIRDARGLNANEKVFLFTVESRGTMTATWQRAADDMGMSKDTFYRTRSALLAKNLIRTQRKFNGLTIYDVDSDSLYANGWVTDSHIENDHSHIKNGDSHQTETKKNTKKNKKKNTNTKKNIEGASAPVDSSLVEINSEDESSLAVVEDRPSLKMTVTAHSHIANEPLPEGVPLSLEERTAADWRAIKRIRPLNAVEKEYNYEKACAFQEERRKSA